MASAPSALPTVPAPRARPWSADASARWAVRVGIFVPLVAIATVVLGRTGASATDRLLLARADLARSGSFEGLRWAYPPIPTFIASIVRTPTLLVASGCVFVALAGLVVAERLAARGLPMWLKVLLVAGIMATPSAWFVITQDVAAVMGLCLLVVAIDGFERFAMEGHTIGGFVTGL